MDEQGEGELLGRGEWKDTVFLPALLGPGYSRLDEKESMILFLVLGGATVTLRRDEEL